MQASPTNRNFFLADFYLPGQLTFGFFFFPPKKTNNNNNKQTNKQTSPEFFLHCGYCRFLFAVPHRRMHKRGQSSKLRYQVAPPPPPPHIRHPHLHDGMCRFVKASVALAISPLCSHPGHSVDWITSLEQELNGMAPKKHY